MTAEIRFHEFPKIEMNFIKSISGTSIIINLIRGQENFYRLFFLQYITSKCGVSEDSTMYTELLS